MTELRARILDAVDRGWFEQLDFLRKLIAERSVRGNTNGAMDVAKPLLGDLGMDVERITLDVDKLRGQPGFSPPEWSYDGAGYHVAACADVGQVEAYWLDEEDANLNPMGAKGVGEIGIVGTAAAIANAVYHATGIRVRELPIHLEKLLWTG